jgi:hypothetical protein
MILYLKKVIPLFFFNIILIFIILNKIRSLILQLELSQIVFSLILE